MVTAAIILNYNDAKATIEAVERIKAFDVFQYIVVVDNASADDSPRLLKEYTDTQNAAAGKEGSQSLSADKTGRAMPERFVFIRSDKNGGYGCGNNIGVRYAIGDLKCTHAVIANPDSVFDEQLIRDMQQVFEAEAAAGTVGAVMTGQAEHISYEEFISSCWPLRGVIGYPVYACPLLKRIFKSCLNYSRTYFKSGSDAGTDTKPAYLRADAVHGSLLMVSATAFSVCGGYDEAVFLYCEEDILASRMKMKGYETFCVLDHGYTHEGSHSITGSGNSAVRRQRFRQESERYYYSRYLHAGACSACIFRVLQSIVLLETKLMAAFGLMR